MPDSVIAIETPQGVVLAEVDDSALGGYEPISIGDDLLVKSRQSLDQAMQTIRTLASSVSDIAAQGARPPSSVELTFGLKFGASSGAIVAKGTAEANLQVKLTWNASEIGP